MKTSATFKHACVVAGVLVTVGAPGSGAPASLLGQTAAIAVHDAWIREPTANRDATAAFAVLENTGTVPRAIVGAATEVAEKVELHEMTMDGAMMRMSPVARVDVPAGGRTELKPGGLHVMLFGLTRRLAAGETIDLTFTVDDGTSVSARAAVRGREDPR